MRFCFSLITGVVLLLTTTTNAFTSVLHNHGRSSAIVYASSSRLADDSPLDDLKVAIVGAGPSGLLLAHRLLKSGAAVSIFEGRRRPQKIELEDRAYALGLGIRARTAIKSVDEELFQAVKNQGYASERFQLHVGPFSIQLRDENDGKELEGVEPSLLMFQTDLCRVLANELEQRFTNKLSMNFECRVSEVNLHEKKIKAESGKSETFDFVVGADGVNSVVRKAMEETWADFDTKKEVIPGVFKVTRLAKMPPKLDPTAVCLLVPQSGSCIAFVEPTFNGSCCIIFSGKDNTDALMSSSNTTLLAEDIVARWPLFEGMDVEEAARQISMQKKSSQAFTVTCNTYNYGGIAALIGDAAHATGGTSGQGVNSALMDAKILADSLVEDFDKTRKDACLPKALLSYSEKQVPEGKALYDLSFGPNPTSPLKKISLAIKTIQDSLFKGRYGIGELPLRTKLTTSLERFADIRRARDMFYDEPFPSDEEFKAQLSALDAKVKVLIAE